MLLEELSEVGTNGIAIREMPDPEAPLTPKVSFVPQEALLPRSSFAQFRLRHEIQTRRMPGLFFETFQPQPQGGLTQTSARGGALRNLVEVESQEIGDPLARGFQKGVEHFGIRNVSDEVEVIRGVRAQEEDHLVSGVQRSQGDGNSIPFGEDKEKLALTQGLPPGALPLPGEEHLISRALPH
jgi:hypothetical protein